MKKALVCALTSALFAFVAASAQQGHQIEITNPIPPKTHLTTNWVFVMDTSHSMNGIFDKSRAAFLHVTSYPTDELFFSVITFNDPGMQKFRDWVPASAHEFQEAARWVEREMRVLSFGQRAVEMALHLERPRLTMILITDGGFTEACEGRGFGTMRQTFADGQEWRRSHGFGEAVICCLGVENIGYTNGHKPPDADCQAFLREIGDQYNGGYFLVRNAFPEPAHPAPRATGH
jgi:hypothetical protein